MGGGFIQREDRVDDPGESRNIACLKEPLSLLFHRVKNVSPQNTRHGDFNSWKTYGLKIRLKHCLVLFRDLCLARYLQLLDAPELGPEPFCPKHDIEFSHTFFLLCSLSNANHQFLHEFSPKSSRRKQHILVSLFPFTSSRIFTRYTKKF